MRVWDLLLLSDLLGHIFDGPLAAAALPPLKIIIIIHRAVHPSSCVLINEGTWRGGEQIPPRPA